MSVGIGDPEWMVKAVLVNADPKLVKVAVLELVGKLFEEGEEMSGFEILDMLLQMSVSGHYYPHVRDALATLSAEEVKRVEEYLRTEKFDTDIDKFLTDLDPDRLNDFLGNDSEGEEDE